MSYRQARLALSVAKAQGQSKAVIAARREEMFSAARREVAEGTFRSCCLYDARVLNAIGA